MPGGCRGRARDLGPGGEPVGHFAAVVLDVKPVTTGPEVRGDAAEGGQELLGVPGVFIARSRARVGCWEFSALLFRYFD
ncbi:MAG TPA: hypothetical protein VFN75_04175 [Pseudonocardiaceae bacterium]|nr:hypothetical protein [Pseudonocardiaceae bacterium]